MACFKSLKKVLFFLTFVPYLLTYSYATEPYRYEIALCAIFQNEASYLEEWIEFHKIVGVQHFYLYNNKSTDEYRKVLDPYIKSGEVDLIEWKYTTNSDGGNWPTIQMMAYNNVLELTRNTVKWLVVIDTDEFLFPVQVDTLQAFLSDFEDYAAVSVNWQMYGTSNVKKISKKDLLIEKLIYKAPTQYGENVHVKTIVRPECVEEFTNPHHADLKPGCLQVNANKEAFEGPFLEPVLIDKIRINHYWTRDERFFKNVKIPRRQKWQDNNFTERANNINKEVDKAIFKYIPQLKKALKKK